MKNLTLRTRITFSVLISILLIITVFVIYNNIVSRQLEEKNQLAVNSFR